MQGYSICCDTDDTESLDYIIDKDIDTETLDKELKPQMLIIYECNKIKEYGREEDSVLAATADECKYAQYKVFDDDLKMNYNDHVALQMVQCVLRGQYDSFTLQEVDSGGDDVSKEDDIAKGNIKEIML